MAALRFPKCSLCCDKDYFDKDEGELILDDETILLLNPLVVDDKATTIFDFIEIKDVNNIIGKL